MFIRVNSWFNYSVNPVIPSKKYGFTLIEVITAVGLLAIIIAFSSVIFRFGIDAYRVSAANADIMQKARAITEQLNSDLRGLQKDAPVAIWFEQAGDNRYDQLMFFADGDFTSMQLYDGGEPVSLDDIDAGGDYISGNFARIHYGQNSELENCILGRRCHILTNDSSLVQWPNESDFAGSIDDPGTTPFYNDSFEHDTMLLNEWKNIDQADFADLDEVAFEHRPLFHSADPNTYHNLLCEGIGSFAVQWAYWDENLSGDNELSWFPQDANSSGVYFNLPDWTTSNWKPIGQTEYKTGENFESDFFPDALKFTFTIYDSKKVIKNGRTFTHIVYLKD